MTRPRHRRRIWSRVATVALLYAFMLAGFVESIAGPSIAAQANLAQSAAAHADLCLIDPGEGPTHEHGHGADCCLPGCRICASNPVPVAHARQVEAFARTAHRVRAPDRTGHPPTRVAAAAPFGARGPPSS
jgi:hypothetical protein